MKNAVRTLMFALIAVGAFVILAPNAAKAVGTASSTPVNNTATVNYQVGGVSQTLIESSPTGNTLAGGGNGAVTSFLVDNIVDLAVATTDGTYIPVQSGGTDYVLTYTVLNEGNTVQDYSLATSQGNDPFNAFAVDTFDATNLRIFVEDGTTPGYQSGEDTVTYVDELSADTTATVYVLGDIPALLANGDISGIVLTATTYKGGGAAALGAIEAESGAPDQALTVDVVFGDGDSVNAGEIDAANNGAHTATSAYKVGAAILTITKTEAIISDPINGTGANRLHIPGAVIEYTITIANGAGGAEATNVTLTDVPDTGNMTFSTTTYDGGNCALAPCGIQVTSPNINLGAAQNLTNASDGDVGSWDGTTATVSGISLLATESATITYRLTIK